MSSSLALISCNAAFREGREGREGQREVGEDVWGIKEREEEEGMEQSSWEVYMRGEERGRENNSLQVEHNTCACVHTFIMPSTS